jgi:hypothetical protein
VCIVPERRPAGFLDMKCQTCYLIEEYVPHGYKYPTQSILWKSTISK